MTRGHALTFITLSPQDFPFCWIFIIVCVCLHSLSAAEGAGRGWGKDKSCKPECGRQSGQVSIGAHTLILNYRWREMINSWAFLIFLPRSLVKNLVVGLLTAPANTRSPALKVVASVLDFNFEERQKVGLEQSSGHNEQVSASLICIVIQSVCTIHCNVWFCNLNLFFSPSPYQKLLYASLRVNPGLKCNSDSYRMLLQNRKGIQER